MAAVMIRSKKDLNGGNGGKIERKREIQDNYAERIIRTVSGWTCDGKEIGIKGDTEILSPDE